LKENIGEKESIDGTNEKLKKELEDMKLKMKEDNELMIQYREAAVNAKVEMANQNYDSQVQLMKLKKRIKRLATKLGEKGVDVKESK